MNTNDAAPIPEVQPPRKPKRRVRKILLSIGGAFVLLIVIIIIASAAGSHSATPSAAPAAKASTSAPAKAAATAKPAPTTAAPTTPAPTTPAAPAMTVAEQQAVDSAQNYLSDGQGFSQAGLFNQLTSSSGEGFTAADANFAISYLHPDWYTQAVESAKGYMQMGGYSHASLMEQLTSSSGEGFTQAQAAYAVAQVGL